MKLRADRGTSLSRFCERIEMSPQRICNIEFGRAPASDDVVGSYIRILDLKGEEAHELRIRASFSNGLKRGEEDNHSNPPLQAFFDVFSSQLSPRAAAEIQRILERESGLSISSLAFSSNHAPSKVGSARKITPRPSLTPKRFVEICLLAEEKRSLVAHEMSPVKLDVALERLCANDEALDYRVVEKLPSFMAGAFACIVGERGGHVILIEERRFLSALHGVHFACHVLMHELAHHYLHPKLLNSDGEIYLAPQSLSLNTPDMICSERKIEQVVDTIEEAEAELFSTMFLVPWTAYLKGTGLTYLANDYGEQLDEVKRYAPHYKNAAVLDEFKKAMWERGLRRHTVFSLN
jgi:hypothetical protein